MQRNSRQAVQAFTVNRRAATRGWRLQARACSCTIVPPQSPSPRAQRRERGGGRRGRAVPPGRGVGRRPLSSLTPLVKGRHGVFVLHVAPSPTLSQGRVCQPKKWLFADSTTSCQWEHRVLSQREQQPTNWLETPCPHSGALN